MPAIVRGLTSIISPTSGVIKIDIDQYGRVIATYSLTASDIPTLTSSKISDFSTAVASIVTNDIGITIQAEDADLNAIAVLSPADGTFIKRASGSWSAGTLTASDIPTITTAKLSDFATASQSQISADIGVSLQAYDSDLDAIAALAPSNGTFIRRTGGVWVAVSLVSADIPNNAANTSGSAGSLSAVLGATAFPALTGDITTIAGALATTLKPSVTIVTPTIASFTNATHTHQNAAGGGTLDAAAITTGVLANTQVNWAAPSTIGSTTPNTGAFTSVAASGTITDTQSIAAVSTDGLILVNSTTAALGVQQWSPRLRLSGRGWATTGSTSQAVDWIVENQPIQGTSSPQSNFVISNSINSSGYTARLTISSTGIITTTGQITLPSSGSLLASGGNALLSRASNVYSWQAASSGIFTQWNNNQGNIILAIDNGGNVGIGTTAPAQLLDLYNGNLRFTQLAAPSAPTAALAGLGAGNVNTGTHSYKITFVTSVGETQVGTTSNVVTTTGANGQVALTGIPLGATGTTSRKIYRTFAGSGNYFLLATIADNTTTTYSDNLADSGSVIAAIPNTTGGSIYVGAIQAMSIDQSGNVTIPVKILPLSLTINGTTSGLIQDGGSSVGLGLVATGTTIAAVSNSGNFSASGTNQWLHVLPGAGIGWSSSGLQNTPDIGFQRVAAGIVKISDGSNNVGAIGVKDALTTSVTNVLTLAHVQTAINAGGNSSGTGLLFAAADSTSAIGAYVSQGRIRTTWVDATDATRTANMIFSVYDTSEHTIITLTPASITLTPRDVATNTVLNSLTLSHNTTGTPAAGFGSAFQFKGDSDTIPDRTMGRVRTAWTTATDASRVANVILSVFNTAEVDALTLTPNNGATIVAVNAAVAAVTNVLTLTHGNTTSGAGSTGLGTGISFLGSDSISGAGTGRTQALIYSIWDEASDSIRAASIHIDAYDGSQRPNITIGANGSVPTLGVLGAAAVPRPTITGSRESNAALASLLTALALAGYITDSTS